MTPPMTTTLMMSSDTLTIPTGAIWKWGGGILSALVTTMIIALGAYVAGLNGRITDHENRLQLIEQTRFSSSDGLELYSSIQVVQTQLIDIKADIADLRNAIR